MATIKYKLNEPAKDGTRSVSIVIRSGSTRKIIPSGIEIKPFEMSRGGKIKDSIRIRQIDAIIDRLKEIIYEAGVNELGFELTAQQIYEMCLSKNDGIDFFSFADKWLSMATIKGKPNYETFLRSLEKYLGVRILPVEKINYTMLNEYSHSLSDRPRAQSLYMGAFRHLYKQMYIEYDIDCRNPFDRFKTPKQGLKGGRAIDFSTLLKVFSYDGKGRAMLARDCAVLSFFLMGTNSVDLYNMNDCSSGYVRYNRTKTKDRRSDNAHMEILIPEYIVPLMEKYKGVSRVFNFYRRYISPEDFNRALNIGLKIIGADIGIDGLQFYQFRHSWATIAYNEVNIDKGVINDCLCHIDRNMRITDLYIKKDYTRINEANAKVVEYVLGKAKEANLIV